MYVYNGSTYFVSTSRGTPNMLAAASVLLDSEVLPGVEAAPSEEREGRLECAEGPER